MSNSKVTSPSQPDTSTQDADLSQVDKPTATLEEDDEFEDFPVEDWAQEDTEAHGTNGTSNHHLWEESWDDDDNTEEFSRQLKDELKKVEGSKAQ